MAPAETNCFRVHMTKDRQSRHQSAERKALHRVVVGPSPTVGGIAGAGSLRSMCTLPCALCCLHSPRRPPVRYPRCIPGFRGHDIYTAGSSAPLFVFFLNKIFFLWCSLPWGVAISWSRAGAIVFHLEHMCQGVPMAVMFFF